MAVGLLKETINKYISEGSPVYACFLDLSKAFERLTHDKLLDKLKEESVPSYIINLINIMFLNSFVSVKYDDAISKKWNLKRGVLQGGVLSAFLFCVYIDDILTSIFQLGFGYQLGINVMNVQAYADDIVLMAPSASGLQKILNRAGNLIAECDLVVNIKKTEVVVFKRKAANLDTGLKLYLYDRPINFVESVKYLGCILSTNLNDFNDIDRCSKSFNRSAGILLKNFCFTDPDILFFLFNSYCTSFYGSELWTMKSGCNTILKEFSIAYHAILKKILKIPKYFSNHYTCLKLNTLCFDHLMNFKCARFLHWLKNSRSLCFYRHKLNFLNFSYFRYYVDNVWRNKYDVENVLENDLDALLYRIIFVQIREPSSMYAI